MRLVRNRDKQEREWQQYKQNGIAESIRRAEFDARHYLDSADGYIDLNTDLVLLLLLFRIYASNRWVEETAYEQAEEILIEKGADSVRYY